MEPNPQSFAMNVASTRVEVNVGFEEERHWCYMGML